MGGTLLPYPHNVATKPGDVVQQVFGGEIRLSPGCGLLDRGVLVVLLFIASTAFRSRAR